ncbi:uncharacterized protein LOC116266137 [Nymphaea colorata]|uniref:uncharacterized protein LOC116266137 n=1 Tax=Nymphaea colorata TaxID=210225 RepID=UPI00129D9BF5|nr:uncharacterized protein LOC116266137 [Nymphaea colorata]
MSPLLLEQSMTVSTLSESAKPFDLESVKLALFDSYIDEDDGGQTATSGAGFDPFALFDKGVGDDYAKKCAWLQKQIIGNGAAFETPFGRRQITYADFTASGRFLQCVEDYISREVLPFYGNTHTVDSHVGLRTTAAVHEAGEYVKRCLGATDGDASLIFCGTGSTAAIKRLQEVMGVTVPSVVRRCVLSCLPESARWVVFTGPYEHHSNLLSWRQSLADVVEIGLDDSGRIDVRALASALASPQYAARPKLGSFSACSNVTGICTDTRAIARVLHEHGAFACFDFASSGPYVDIEMKTGEIDGYDAIFISPHKFLGGPGSPGILVVNNALYRLKGAPPSTSGGGTVLFVNGYCEEDTLYCKDVEEREDAGTPGIVQKIRAALAFAVKEYMGHDLICSRERAFLDVAISRLGKNGRIRLLGNSAIKERLPTISFLIYPAGAAAGGKHLHCRFVTTLLNDLFGIQARGGCACAGPYGHALLGIDRARSTAIRETIEKGYTAVKPGWTRVSFCYYMPMEEIHFVIDAVELVAAYGHRFLNLYRFDWKSGDWSFKKMGAEYTQMIKLLGRVEERSTRCEGPGATDVEYAECMEAAKRVAMALPDFPTNRKTPEVIDPELVDFIV